MLSLYANTKEDIMFAYNLWQGSAFFIIYCLLGWIGESLYVSWEHRKWVNRGFLHGPFLPIYGFGAVIILISTIPVRNNYFLIFLFGMLGATLLEYFTGWAMEQIFHVKYWDYTYDFCNLHGYICLGCSLTWGVCALLLTGLVHTPIEKLVLSLPAVPLMVIDIVFAVYFIWDMITSAQEAFDLKKIILENEDVQRIQKRLDVIHAFAEDDKEKFEDYLKEKNMQYNKNKEELTKEFEAKLQAAKDRVANRSEKAKTHATRIIRRNPGSISYKHKEEFEAIRKRIEERLQSKR